MQLGDKMTLMRATALFYYFHSTKYDKIVVAGVESHAHQAKIFNSPHNENFMHR